MRPGRSAGQGRGRRGQAGMRRGREQAARQSAVTRRIGERRCRRAGQVGGCIGQHRGPAGLDVQPHRQGIGEDVEGGAGPGIDLDQVKALPAHEEIGAVQADQAQRAGQLSDSLGHRGLEGGAGGPHRTAVPECRIVPRVAPLRAEAEHCRAMSVRDEARADRPAGEAALGVPAARRPGRVPCADVRPAGATTPLQQPGRRGGRADVAGTADLRVGHAGLAAHRGQGERVVGMTDHLCRVAEKPEAGGQGGDHARPVLEAAAQHQPRDRAGASRQQAVKRPYHCTGRESGDADAARRQRDGVVVAEQVDGQWRKPGPACGSGQRPGGLARHEQQRRTGVRRTDRRPEGGCSGRLSLRRQRSPAPA